VSASPEASRNLAAPVPDRATRRAARVLAVAVAIAIPIACLLQLAFLPSALSEKAPLLTIIIGASCACALVFVGVRGSWRTLAIPAVVVIDAGAILAGGVLPIGLDIAVSVPILGAILVVSILDGWPMRIALASSWLSGVVGAWLARSSPEVASIPNVAPVPFAVGMLGVGTFLGYLVLAWAAGHWRASVAQKEGAAEAARLAERTASTALERLRTTVENSPLPTVTLDRDGIVDSWNPASERLLGWAAGEVIGSRITEIVPENLHPAVRERLAQAADGQLPGPRSTSFLHKNGTEVRAEVHDALERDGDGNIVGIVVQFLDLTERESIAARLVESQRLEAVGQLAGGVAHDFNNSLTAIAGFASLIASGDSPDPSEDARTILTAAEHAATLTRQLLAFSRRVPLNAQLVDLREFLIGVEPLVRSLVGETIHVRIESERSPELAEVDPPSLEQAILNLTANARDAMPQGGELTLAVRRYANCVASGEDDPQAHVALVASDTGTGIPAGSIDHVFEPFFTTKPPGKGTGLGLAMVHGFVAQSGGHVVVSSPPGQGATFELHFPAASGVVPAASGLGGPIGGTESILFVEDDPGVASFGLACLRRLGYDVTPAMNGSEAIVLASSREHPFDLLFTDVVIPGMSGPELAALIHRHHPDTAILYSSGYGPDQIGDTVADVDAPMLEKPYSLERLASMVRKSLETRHNGRGSTRPD